LKSESDLVYDWRFIVNRFVLARSPMRLTTTNFIFQLNTCSYSPHVTSSLMKIRACRFLLLLVLASAVILRSESRGTHYILLSQTRDSPNLEGQVLVYTCISPRNRVAQLYPSHWVPFSSPSTTRRAVMEVFHPTSTRVLPSESVSRLETKLLVNNVYIFGPYHTGNTWRLRYKAQPVSAVALYYENHTKEKSALCGHDAEFFYVKHVVHAVTTMCTCV
jgi:hypothetical protein